MPAALAPDTRTRKTPPSPELAPALRMALARLVRRIRQADVDLGVTLSQLSVLRVLNEQPWMTIGELAAAERVQPPTMTRMVAAVEQQELVRRKADEQDRRSVRLAVTEKGKRLLADSLVRRNAYLAERLHALSPKEIAALTAALPVLERLAEED